MPSIAAAPAGVKLTLASGNDEADACYEQYGAKRGRNFFIVFGGDADVGVADANAVMFRMWKRNEERDYSQNKDNHSCHRQSSHADAPVIKTSAR
jgi:hypothetical protein